MIGICSDATEKLRFGVQSPLAREFARCLAAMLLVAKIVEQLGHWFVAVAAAARQW